MSSLKTKHLDSFIVEAVARECDAHTKIVVVSVVSGGENRGHKRRTSYGRISIINRVPLDHRYQTT